MVITYIIVGTPFMTNLWHHNPNEVQVILWMKFRMKLGIEDDSFLKILFVHWKTHTFKFNADWKYLNRYATTLSYNWWLSQIIGGSRKGAGLVASNFRWHCFTVSKCIAVNEGSRASVSLGNCNQIPSQVSDQNCETKFNIMDILAKNVIGAPVDVRCSCQDSLLKHMIFIELSFQQHFFLREWISLLFVCNFWERRTPKKYLLVLKNYTSP